MAFLFYIFSFSAKKIRWFFECQKYWYENGTLLLYHKWAVIAIAFINNKAVPQKTLSVLCPLSLCILLFLIRRWASLSLGRRLTLIRPKYTPHHLLCKISFLCSFLFDYLYSNYISFVIATLAISKILSVENWIIDIQALGEECISMAWLCFLGIPLGSSKLGRGVYV